MRLRLPQRFLFGTLGLTTASLGCGAAVDVEPTEQSGEGLTTSVTTNDAVGQVKVVSTDAVKGLDLNNPFFKSLGVNGRTCNSCHKLENAMGISVAMIKQIFDATSGLDPIFRINDGSNAPTGFYADTSSLSARKVSFSMLLNHGVIRVGIGVPSGANFHLQQAQDPYGFASAAELSLFRRPLPSVNVAFNTLTMWDGRESEGRPVNRDALKNQANDATTGHAERPTPLDDATRSAIADFQLQLFAAQSRSNLVGALNVKGCDQSASDEEPGACEAARGGPSALPNVLADGNDDFPGPFAAGKNDPFPFRSGGLPSASFNNISFIIYEPWESETLGPNPTVNGTAQDATLTKNRGEIGDGENIFYTKPINITGVAGLNDVTGQSVIHGTCTTCHNNPDVGNHSRPRFFNIGTSSPFLGDNPLAGALIDFPKYVIQRNSDGVHQTTTDPGLALRTGQYADVGRFKVPNLRGLANRAPYFHNGQAATLTDVLNFYNQRFGIGFTSEEIRKVVLFLQQS
jgi:cytochrome c peroxidase